MKKVINYFKLEKNKQITTWYFGITDYYRAKVSTNQNTYFWSIVNSENNIINKGKTKTERGAKIKIRKFLMLYGVQLDD